jgi:hypothetical protein
MKMEINLRRSLLALRLSCFLVMFMWTLDKIINPGHASAIFEKFYFLSGFGPSLMMGIAIVELLIILGFLAGLLKTFTYGLVFLFHAISTLSSFSQYLSPFEKGHLLFFAAWPMLAALFTLFLLREEDKLYSLS